MKPPIWYDGATLIALGMFFGAIVMLSSFKLLMFLQHP